MKKLLILAIFFIQYLSVHSQQVTDQSQEVIYGRKDGMALTMLVHPPSVTSNARAIIWIVSAGWTSDFKKVSSRVQAVACFFPPVDLLNWKAPGDNAVIRREIKEFQAPLDFVEWNAQTLHYILITDSVKRTEIGREISPLYFVTSDDPPTLIVHGDADKLVPLFQSREMIEKLKESNVPCELIVKSGADHGFWNDMSDYTTMFAAWFDKYLSDN